MISRFRLVATLALLLPVVGAAQQTTPPLTLEECIARALGQNFDLQIQTFTKDSAGQTLLIAEADFEPDLTFTTSRSESVQATASSTLDGAANPSTTAYNNRLSATQRISTGATVTAATNLNRAGSNSRNALLNPSFNSDFALTVRQPLLAGS